MYMTRHDLKALTDCGHRSGQIAWLRDRCWPFEISAKGYPKVLYSVMVARMGGKIEDSGPRLRLDDAAEEKAQKPSGKDVPEARKVLLRSA